MIKYTVPMLNWNTISLNTSISIVLYYSYFIFYSIYSLTKFLLYIHIHTPHLFLLTYKYIDINIDIKFTCNNTSYIKMFIFFILNK